MSITPEEKLKRIRDSINDIKSVTEVMIKARIKTVSSSMYTIENKDIADALIEFAEELVKVCGDDKNRSKCAKALYLQKVIKLKTDPNNYNKNIKITDDIDNIDMSTPDPTVEEDPPVTTVDSTTVDTVVSTPVTTVDSTPGATVVSTPVTTVDTIVSAPVVDSESNSLDSANGPPASVAPLSDKNRVILSYEDGSYLVKDEFKSNYHVLERKDETQCFAYNPSYNQPNPDSIPEQGALQGFGKKFSSAAENAGKTLSGAAENAGKTLTGALQSIKNKFGTEKKKNYDTIYTPGDPNNATNVNSPLHTNAKTGGKRRTKKRRITRKRNQQKLRLFKSRSKK